MTEILVLTKNGTYVRDYDGEKYIERPASQSDIERLMRDE